MSSVIIAFLLAGFFMQLAATSRLSAYQAVITGTV
jgi:hypothetical protein